MTSIIMMYGISFLSIMLIMLLLWGYYLVRKNAGVVDLGWCLTFMVTGITFFFFGNGNPVKRLTLLAMILIWSFQLFSYIYRRFSTQPADPRYVAMIGRWDKDGINVKVLLMFLFQGFLALVISSVFLFPFMYSGSEWHHFEVVGIVVWAIGVMGEFQSNRQLQKFKSKPENKGKVYSQGWWRYSRHPNYFFEFVVWLGFGLFALGSSFGFLGLISPIIILYLLLNLSGVPLAEAQSIKSSGNEYKEYQEKTSAFFPWFPKS